MDERVALPGRVSTLSLVSSRPTGTPAEFFSVFSVWMISPFFVGMTCNDDDDVELTVLGCRVDIIIRDKL